MKYLFILVCALFVICLHADVPRKPKEYFYFAYGANMNSQMLYQLLASDSAKCVGCYRLDGYQFAYNRAPLNPKQEFTGGNIQPKAGCSVYGVVWKLSEKELSILDQVEECPRVYRRATLQVTSPNNPQDVRQVEVYIANQDYISATSYPRPFYVKVVTEGAKEHHLPSHYINEYLNWSGPWGKDGKKSGK